VRRWSTALAFLGSVLVPLSLASAQGVLVTCVGPHVVRVIPGDWKHGGKDTVIGATPDLITGPGGLPAGRKLPAGGAYLADRHVHGFYRLVGTHYSPPFPFGAAVGWVREPDMTGLATRNCN
jgi:hypothetical protein